MIENTQLNLSGDNIDWQEKDHHRDHFWSIKKLLQTIGPEYFQKKKLKIKKV